MAENNGIKEELVRQNAEVQNRLGNLTGRLEGLEKKIDELDKNINELKDEIKNLNSFRWKVYGAASAVGFLAGLLGAVITLIIHFKG